jgi:transposase
MEAEMMKFNGLANVIQSKRMQGMNYYEIAEELGYSYHYIRNYMSKKGCKEGATSAKAS